MLYKFYNNQTPLGEWFRILFDETDLVWTTFDVERYIPATNFGEAGLYLKKYGHDPDLRAMGLRFGLNPALLGWSRQQAGVALYRNFMFELDPENEVYNEAEQLELIRKTGLPYSSIVWSGNKSLHVIVSLETPISFSEYKQKWREICASLAGYNTANLKWDEQTSSAAQLARAPISELPSGSCRPQKAIELKTRIKNEELEAWLQKPRNKLNRSFHRWFKPQLRREKVQSNDEWIFKILEIDSDQAYVDCPCCAGFKKLSVGRDEGRALLHCFKGCSFKEIIDALREQATG